LDFYRVHWTEPPFIYYLYLQQNFSLIFSFPKDFSSLLSDIYFLSTCFVVVLIISPLPLFVNTIFIFFQKYFYINILSFVLIA